ncbi:MAG TPA: APC family permease [Streptosporangiaceae bacterium]|jgi:amino acid transporter|nr:APC family permease [Streptosporangiaceae bacterium]
MAVEAGKPSTGSVKTELRENAVGLPGMLMQGIATIGPSFAILASFVFIVSFAGLVTPWAYLFGGILLGLQALAAAQLAKVFPSAGGWYTWIARALHPRAGFFAGVLFSIWLPPVATLTMSFLAKTVLEPSIKAEYGVDVPWWIWVVAGVALVVFFAYQGISISEKALIITGLIEIVIMVALAFTGLASPGPGGFSFGPLNPGNFGLAGNLFLGVVFSIFAFSGWESTGPLAEESKNPKRNVPIGLVGSVVLLTVYFVFVTWGYLVGIGVSKVGSIPTASAFPVATLAQRVWGGAWVLLLFALLNSAIALSIACFNGGTRTWYAMGRSGVLPKMVGKVNPTRKTPVNAISLQVGVQVLAFVCVLIWGAEDVFFSWANAITIGLVLMYVLCNIGVVRYYLTEGRAQFNPLLHIVVPVIASAAGVVVVWKSYFSPFTSTGPVFWGLMTFIVVLVLTVVILIYLRVTGREDWMRRAQLVFEQSGGGH